MPKVFVTRPIPDAGLKLLKQKGYQVTVNQTKKLPSQKQIIKAISGKGYDAILSVLTEKIDAKVLDAAGPQLKIVANYAVGFDNIDLAQAKKRNIYVTNAPCPEITESVAEHCLALMLNISRRVSEADRFIRGKKYAGWDPFLLLGSDLTNKTLGVIGLGRIGAAVARRSVKGLGMKVVYYDVKANPEFENEYQTELKTVEEVLKVSDFVSLHVPLLPATRHLISEKQLKMMKPSAFLINTARGPVVDEKALVKALKSKIIAGAALDVFEFEPKLATGLEKLPNVVLTPHIASGTIETRQAMSVMAAKNIIAALSGQLPFNIAK